MKTPVLRVQGYSGSGSTGSEDEDMDSEDEEIDMGEVGPLLNHLPDMPSIYRSFHEGCFPLSSTELRAAWNLCLLRGLVAGLQDAALAAEQDPEGDSQSEEIGMADRLDNEMDEGSMDTDDEHDHADGRGGQYSDEDEVDEDDDDANDGQVLRAAL